MAVTQQKLVSLYVRKLKNLVELDIDFRESPVTAILGPNGNGKTTVLHALACAYQPVSDGENLKFSNFFLPRSLTENSARSEDGRKLRMKIRFCEENSELFDEQKRIFRPICCHRSRADYSRSGS